MNRKNIMILSGVFAIVIFAISSFAWLQSSPSNQSMQPKVAATLLERDYSPSFGPADAKVTIVEFFDPACEACRAFYPVVKEILEKKPQDVRVVLRYTTFHKGSDQVVRILEASRLQNLFKPVLEAILTRQPEWAIHGQPNIDKAWQIAASVGLNLSRAKIDIQDPKFTALLKQEALDVQSAGVKKTPTFFVNGKSLPSFGAQQLFDLVMREVKAD
ncbi:MAG: thioredoxin domain-containing protein [Oceanospirillaceae bacterium]